MNRTETGNRWARAAALASVVGMTCALSVHAADDATGGVGGPARSGAVNNDADGVSDLPASLNLDATIRDFKAKNESGGHPDFESYGNANITTGLVNGELDSDGKPVFRGRRGMQITANYRDRAGRIINPTMFSAESGDTPGALSEVASDQLTSAESFSQWYRDASGVNLSQRVALRFNRVPGTARYVFDSATDGPYRERGGFFPIDGELFGNFAGTGHNFAFTTEISTTFLFERSKNHVFTFTGDDDVWVFIDNKLVIDVGGLHPQKEQSLELNRLSWLADGQTHTLKVFHAERHTNASNFRIETTLLLRRVEPPPTTGMYD